MRVILKVALLLAVFCLAMDLAQAQFAGMGMNPLATLMMLMTGNDSLRRMLMMQAMMNGMGGGRMGGGGMGGGRMGGGRMGGSMPMGPGMGGGVPGGMPMGGGMSPGMMLSMGAMMGM